MMQIRTDILVNLSDKSKILNYRAAHHLGGASHQSLMKSGSNNFEAYFAF